MLLHTEELDFLPETFDVVISLLAFHYARDFESLVKNIYRWMKTDGVFVFSVEHPVFRPCPENQGTALRYDCNC